MTDQRNREDRLAAKLRENLKRRKVQARALSEQEARALSEQESRAPAAGNAPPLPNGESNG